VTEQPRVQEVPLPDESKGGKAEDLPILVAPITSLFGSADLCHLRKGSHTQTFYIYLLSTKLWNAAIRVGETPTQAEAENDVRCNYRDRFHSIVPLNLFTSLESYVVETFTENMSRRKKSVHDRTLY
jgi:hypothetical protein